MTFIDELLAESEVRDAQERIEMNKLKADQILAALSVIEKKADDINCLANEEIDLIEKFRQTELAKLEKQASWMAYQLESFMRALNQEDPSCKSVSLPHGGIKLRQGRDKVEITDMEKFLKVAEKRGLLKTVPETFEPDMQKVLTYVKLNGFLMGVVLIKGQTKFYYTTKGKDNGETTEPEA